GEAEGPPKPGRAAEVRGDDDVPARDEELHIRNPTVRELRGGTPMRVDDRRVRSVALGIGRKVDERRDRRPVEGRIDDQLRTDEMVRVQAAGERVADLRQRARTYRVGPDLAGTAGGGVQERQPRSVG